MVFRSGYEVPGFSFTAGAGTGGLANPLLAGVVPGFVIRNDDPAVDGFFTGTNIDGHPNGIPPDSNGSCGAFVRNFSITYDADPLPSPNTPDALGACNSTGLTVFDFVVHDRPFNVMGLNFESMTITAAPISGAVWPFGAGIIGLPGLRCR